MARRFEYPCPDCWTTNNLHQPGCRFEGRPWTDVEKAYVDLVARLSVGPHAEGGRPDEAALREAVGDDWEALHVAVLDRMEQQQRVRETDGALELLTPDEHVEQVSEPTAEPMKTIYEKGSVPGCHDNAVFALIAWYEMVGLSWEETRRNVVEWLHESGTWERGGFEEATPEALVDDKRHVYEEGYGWKEKARAAKGIIDRSL